MDAFSTLAVLAVVAMLFVLTCIGDLRQVSISSRTSRVCTAQNLQVLLCMLSQACSTRSSALPITGSRWSCRIIEAKYHVDFVCIHEKENDSRLSLSDDTRI